MIQRIIDEINIALDKQLHLVALTAALTLPDVCGKAEYPKCKTSERYNKWYSNYVTDGNIPANDIYALRCSLLHEGNTETSQKDAYRFTLITNSFVQPLGIEFCFNAIVEHADESSEKSTIVYVGYLCTAICRAAQVYYQTHKDKFRNINYEIHDIASEFEQ